jgi:hypothetical protein
MSRDLQGEASPFTDEQNFFTKSEDSVKSRHPTSYGF